MWPQFSSLATFYSAANSGLSKFTATAQNAPVFSKIRRETVNQKQNQKLRTPKISPKRMVVPPRTITKGFIKILGFDSTANVGDQQFTASTQKCALF